ncbi:MAG: hypothetical protein AAGC99_17560 [Pseudomonadota bacterium]
MPSLSLFSLTEAVRDNGPAFGGFTKCLSGVLSSFPDANDGIIEPAEIFAVTIQIEVGF